jgi:DNA-binding response OmpR family regulator
MKKILVVDNDQDILQLVEYILTSKGFDVLTHSTSVNVAKMVKYYAPNLILLDIHLPEKLGTQICKELKEIYTVPIILTSAYADHRKSFIKSNADAFILKPFDIEQLVNTINLHIS